MVTTALDDTAIVVVDILYLPLSSVITVDCPRQWLCAVLQVCAEQCILEISREGRQAEVQ